MDLEFIIGYNEIKKGFVVKVPSQSQQPVHVVLVISKKSADGKVLLVKQNETCRCSDAKLRQYRQENRLLIVNLDNQCVFVQQGELAERLKQRGVERIEFTRPVEGAPIREAIDVHGVDIKSDEEFTELMVSSLKEAEEFLKKEEQVGKGFCDKSGFRNTPNLREIIRQYMLLHPKKAVSEIISNMLKIWNTAAKDDREQQRLSQEKYQRLREDILRRVLLDRIKKDEIEKRAEMI